jgi:hypothetical protein
MNILIEAILVGIAIAIIGFVISLLLMYIEDNKFTIKKYTFWKSVLLSNFLTGMVGHLFFQYVGLNSYYCKYGVACQK